MTKVRCLIVDDESLARELIETHINQLSGYEIVASCASAIEAAQWLKESEVDLVFLDIEMPVLRGTDFYKNLVNKPRVIFTTAFRDYAIDGFELDAVDYLLKPITFARFFQAIERFEALHTISTKRSSAIEQSMPHLFVRKDRKNVKIELDKILYVQGLKDYIKIVMQSESHIIKHGISAFAALLGTGFIRVHRSYIVNRNRITAYSRHDIEIGEFEVPIGENYRDKINQHLRSDIG